MNINIPLTVPPLQRFKYLKNFRSATQGTGRLFLLAADQRLEHLNNDFAGVGIHADDQDPEHLFRIAAKTGVGVLAAHLGLIAAYAHHYRGVNYLVKLNGKSNLVGVKTAEPQSLALNTVAQTVELQKQNRLKISGVGYTIYLGSQHESAMLTEASQIIYQAHQQGLITALWLYPRGAAIKDGTDPQLIAGAAGAAACLGADFVKLPFPLQAGQEQIKTIVKAAGRTGVIFSGGAQLAPAKFLQRLNKQISWGARGCAVGRNIHQKDFAKAVLMAKAVKSACLFDYTAVTALNVYHGKKKLVSRLFL